jgi:hypothetical protein
MMLEKIRKLLKSETAADIRAALAAVDLNALRADVDAAESKRQGLLLTGKDAQILEAEAEITTARLALDRAVAATAALETKLAAAEAKEFDQAFERDRAAVVAQCEYVARELQKIGPAAAEVERICALVRDATNARTAIYKRMVDDITGLTAAGRSTEVPSPVASWTCDGIPGWAVGMVERADGWGG